MALYGFVLLMAAFTYFILQARIIKTHEKNSIFAKAIGKEVKRKISPPIYIIAIFSCLWSGGVAAILYITIAFIWLIPDKRIEVIVNE